MAKNKLYQSYPFPFLSEDTSDYKKTSFTLDVNYKPLGKTIELQIRYIINNDELNELIKNGDLKVVAKIVCSTMGFSKIAPFESGYNSTTQIYNSMLLDDDVEITAFLLANKEFALNNRDLNDFWIKERPIIQVNNIIGESNTKTITITHVKSGTSRSIFQFTQKVDKEDIAPFSYSLTNDECIVFSLSPKQFRQFLTLKTSEKGKQFIISTFIIPVLTDILRCMINTDHNEEGELIENEFNINHGGKKWYIVLSDNYSKAFDGKDPTIANETSPIEAAQALIDRFAINNVLAFAIRFKKEL